MRGMEKIMIANFGTEVIYSFIIIACSLMIYFSTRELYNISSHKGIKYFRLSFLFFAFAYFSRSFIKLILAYFNAPGLNAISPNLLPPLVGIISLFLFIYFSTIAIFYLFYSGLCKKINKSQNKTYLLHTIALILAGIILLFNRVYFYITINVILFLIVLLTAIYSKKTSDKNVLQTTYLLLSFFWTLNILDILIPQAFTYYQLLIYLASASIFLLITYRVIRKLGN